MQKRKMPRDSNQLAAQIVAMSTGQPVPKANGPEKNPAAVALGRLGGLKGGKARAASMSAKRRQGIARAAAVARWKRARNAP